MKWEKLFGQSWKACRLLIHACASFSSWSTYFLEWDDPEYQVFHQIRVKTEKRHVSVSDSCSDPSSSLFLLLNSNIMKCLGAKERASLFWSLLFSLWMHVCIYWALLFMLLIGWLTKTLLSGSQTRSCIIKVMGRLKEPPVITSEKNTGEDPRAVLAAPRDVGCILSIPS